jgi:hypothetical protein
MNSLGTDPYLIFLTKIQIVSEKIEKKKEKKVKFRTRVRDFWLVLAYQGPMHK